MATAIGAITEQEELATNHNEVHIESFNTLRRWSIHIRLLRHTDL